MAVLASELAAREALTVAQRDRLDVEALLAAVAAASESEREARRAEIAGLAAAARETERRAAAELAQATAAADAHARELAECCGQWQAAEMALRVAQEETLRSAVQALEERRAALDAEQRAMEGRVQRAQETAAAAELALADLARTESGQVAALIAAHRAAVVGIMERLIDSEVERIKAKAGFREKLEDFLEPFYMGTVIGTVTEPARYLGLLTAALTDVARVHLAFIRSPEDPKDLAKRYAQAHVDESLRQLRVVLDGDADDLATSVGALLRRWQDRRPSVIADDWMQKELDHVRR